MNNLCWMGHAANIQEMQKSLHEDTTSCEITLAARGKSIKVHRFILSACSDLLRTLLADVPLGQEATIMLPDIEGNLLQTVFDFIYLGGTNLAAAELCEFLEAMNTIGIKAEITFEWSAAHASQLGADGVLQIVDNTNDDMPLGKQILTHDQDLDKLEEQLGADGVLHMADKTMDVMQLGTQILTPDQGLDEFEEQHIDTEHPITYLIQHVRGKEYKITESSGSKIRIQNVKLESVSVEPNDEAGDNRIVGKHINSADPESNKYIKSLLIIAKNAIPNNQENTYPISPKTNSDNGMGLQNATTKYEMTNTIVERLKAGKTLKSISMELDIPLSTLHRHKVKLVSEGKLPESFVRRRNFHSHKIRQVRLDRAVQSYQNEGMSQYRTAKKNGEAKSTFWRHIQAIAPKPQQ